MSIHDGVVTLDNNDIQVILGVEEDSVRLSAGGVEIGEWSFEECTIDPAGEGKYNITAENEVLLFVPNDHGSFSAVINGSPTEIIDERTAPTEPRHAKRAEDVRGESAFRIEEAPEPKAVTLAAFYTLVIVTLGLGGWALVSLF